ncbi:ATP-grasp domain-containing protein [Glutamicibacter sp. TV12E]|uniref:ATP-grasp domain-containing protein n=1 Tax=Glutamicibacter sp. TV12E TaxID=3446362 RepID=UPI0040338C39
MNILITGVGGPAGSSLARQLHDRGHQVIGVDMNPVEDEHLGVFLQVPAARDASYVHALREIIRQQDVALVIPTVSEELPILAMDQNRELLESAGAAVLLSSETSIRIADDKYLTMLVLNDDHVPVPDFVRGDLYGRPSVTGFLPHQYAIVKPRVSRGGRGVRLLASSQLTDGSQDLSSLDLVQRFAPGREFAPMLFRHPDTKKVDVCVVVEKTELREGLIGNAVSVQRCEFNATTAHVAQVARAAVASLDLVGPVDLDIRLTDEGQPVVLEINARFGANSAAAPELVDSVLQFASSPVPGKVGNA